MITRLLAVAAVRVLGICCTLNLALHFITCVKGPEESMGASQTKERLVDIYNILWSIHVCVLDRGLSRLSWQHPAACEGIDKGTQ